MGRFFQVLDFPGICDRDLRAINVIARFSGRVHDQFIWRDSIIKQEMERLHRDIFGDFKLIGDSGYAPEPWLLIPITNAARGTPEALYTETHCRGRNVTKEYLLVSKKLWQNRWTSHQSMIMFETMRPMRLGQWGLLLFNNISTIEVNLF
uniref:(California timema) hypothetical protein n=1 Tax=Timema californicum TaxID=61474 RepID=A0A7R9JJV7_TIMCA|nr:unnamed protein product [Timema californicum]